MRRVRANFGKHYWPLVVRVQCGVAARPRPGCGLTPCRVPWATRPTWSECIREHHGDEGEIVSADASVADKNMKETYVHAMNIKPVWQQLPSLRSRRLLCQDFFNLSCSSFRHKLSTEAQSICSQPIGITLGGSQAGREWAATGHKNTLSNLMNHFFV